MMSTPDDLNTSADADYRELCDVLKQLVQLEEKYEEQGKNNWPTKKQCELLTTCLKLLKQSVKVNINSTENSDSPLHYAIQLENQKFVEMLLLKGANVNVKNGQGETPLHLAVRKSAKNIIQLLLKKGADLNIFNSDGSTPFQFLLKFCDESMINILSQNRVNFVVPGNSGKQCLQIAIARDSLKMVKFILDNSVELEEQDKTDTTILCEAIMKGNIEIVELILKKGYNVNADSETSKNCFSDGKMPFHVATRSSCKTIIKLLLNYNADVNNRDKYGQSALHTAVIYNRSADIINLLLENGADLKAKDNFDMMPLMYASGLNCELVPILLGDNPDKNDKDNKLAFCLSFVEDKAFRILEDFNDNNRDTNNGWFNSDNTHSKVFRFKSYTKKIKTSKCAAQLFVECGLTLHIEDFNDMRIPEKLYHCVKNAFEVQDYMTSVEDVLNEKQAINPEETDRYYLMYKVLIGSVQRGFTDIVHNLIAPFVNVNAYLISGYTLFLDAIFYQHLPIVEELLRHGADVNTVHKDSKMSALHLAVLNNDLDIITCLLKKNAYMEIRNNRNETPLILAVRRDSYKVTLLLLKAGADLKAKDNFGMVPLMYATELNSKLLPVLLGNNPDKNDKDNKLAFCLSFVKDDEFSILEDFNDNNRDTNNSWYNSHNTYGKVLSFQSYTKEIEASKCAAQLFVDCGFTLHIEDFNDMRVPEKLYHYVKNTFKVKDCMTRVEDIFNEKLAINPEETDRYYLMYKVLIGSVQRGFTDIVHNLMAPFVNVNAHLKSEYTLFLLAVFCGHLPVVEELLRHGADVNALHKVNKMSTVHLAVLNNYLDIVTFLLKNNAYIDARDKLNRTPLFLAVDNDFYEITLSLLKFGANSNIVDVEGRSPLSVAIDNDSEEIIEILIRYGALIDKQNLCKLNRDWLFGDCDFTDFRRTLFDHDAFSSNLNFSHLLKIDDQIKYAVCKGSKLKISQNSKIYNFHIKSQNEIEKMKLTRIEGSNLSIHDVLMKSSRQIATYLRDENVVKILESMNFEKTFPIFRSKLEVHLRKGKIAVQLLKIGYHCLKLILKLAFPAVVIYEILSYFEDRELRRLIFASPIDDALKSLVDYKDKGEDEDEDEDENLSFFFQK